LRHLHEGHATGLPRIPAVDGGDGFDISVGCKKFSQLLLRRGDVEVPIKMLVTSSFSLDLPEISQSGMKRSCKRRSCLGSPLANNACLEWPYVFSLPAFGTLRHVELHSLPFLKTLEPARLDCREMHKNILATLTADEAVAFGVVEPLYRSLFCHIDTRVPLIDLRWRDSEVLKAGYWLVGRELLTTDSVKRTLILRARRTTGNRDSTRGVESWSFGGL